MVRMFVLSDEISDKLKMGHVGSKTRSLGQILEKHFVCSRGHIISPLIVRVPRGSVVRCLTRNPGVLGSSLTRSSGFFRGSVLGQDTSEPSLVLVKPRKA